MTSFIFNLVLAFLWAATIGNFNLVNLIVGFFVGAVIIWYSRWAFDKPVYLLRIARIARLVAWAATEFMRAALLSVRTSVGLGRRRAGPGSAKMSLSLDRDEEIAALLLLMSVSPRSVPSELSKDRTFISLQIVDEPNVVRPISTERKIERWLLECLR